MHYPLWVAQAGFCYTWPQTEYTFFWDQILPSRHPSLELRSPPGTRPPWEQTPPLGADPPVDTPHPPQSRHPPPCSIRSTSGRYASYWNAFLFQNMLRFTGNGYIKIKSILRLNIYTRRGDGLFQLCGRRCVQKRKAIGYWWRGPNDDAQGIRWARMNCLCRKGISDRVSRRKSHLYLWFTIYECLLSSGENGIWVAVTLSASGQCTWRIRNAEE